MSEQPDYYVKSAEKTLAVLLAFNGASAVLTVTEVAAAWAFARRGPALPADPWTWDT